MVLIPLERYMKAGLMPPFFLLFVRKFFCLKFQILLIFAVRINDFQYCRLHSPAKYKFPLAVRSEFLFSQTSLRIYRFINSSSNITTWRNQFSHKTTLQEWRDVSPWGCRGPDYWQKLEIDWISTFCQTSTTLHILRHFITLIT